MPYALGLGIVTEHLAMRPASSAPPAPQESTASNFKVVKKLGQGSYGTVYKVERERDGQVYAMKETDLSKMSQQERMDAVNEVRLLVSISHVNVIRYHETFVNNQKLYFIMEYSPFGDLNYYISKGRKNKTPFPEEVVWRLLLQLCFGLMALHDARIIHRDIKPANIFLGKQDLLKIGDLGVAKALKHIQLTHTTIGTPCYMAPEVWRGLGYNFNSDLWSVGAVLYEMMTFRQPFAADSISDLATKIVRGVYQPITAGPYSQDLISICHSLLHVNPLNRPSLTKIINCEASKRWRHVVPDLSGLSDSAKANLMDTIQVPRDIRLLQHNLPPPSYDSQ